ncbi:MAG: DTW domain-containing protein YfiP [Bacteriovoracaceae bacterium]|jgi:DTW domain-containing protein YfiP
MKRKTCENCLRPVTVCYCNEIQRQDNSISIIILQHPDEAGHPLGTGQMACLTFSNCQKFTGINFDNDQYFQSIIAIKNAAILYPSEAAMTLKNITQSSKSIELLIVLDGTWRKAKRIYEATSSIQSLPKVQLPKNYESKYLIRKAPKSNYLSTFESITYSLNILEKKEYSSSLKVLELQVEKHIKKMGKKFHRFYKKDD